MFALQYIYLVFLGTWLGSLVTMRYILPSAIAGYAADRNAASASALYAIGVVNKLGIACGIAMAGALFLQRLLSGELFLDAKFLILLVLTFILLGLSELLYIRKFQLLIVRPVETEPEGKTSPSAAKKIIPFGLRLILLAQIIISLLLFGFSV